ncbi:protein FAR1-RELATED SEQUENCE 6, partial [Trifolium medium]|nr:protein FAR1-RELATED SEQUENCE 6 [Trifolium medium]
MSMKPPPKKVNTEGAPKKTRFSQAERSTKRDLSYFEHMDSSQLPPFMHEYYTDVVDVEGDGHCRFRDVSVLLGKSEEAYQMVRLDLTIELNHNRARYVNLFGGKERFDFIKNALTPHAIGPVYDDKWMTMPDIGFLLAQRYKHAVVVLGGNGG